MKRLLVYELAMPGLYGQKNVVSYDTSTDSADELSQSEFLELMIAQLEHQDPLNPTDNAAFVSQMAEISSVDSLAEFIVGEQARGVPLAPVEG